jgi:hypothetical protein
MNQNPTRQIVPVIAKAIEWSDVTLAMPEGAYSVFSPAKEGFAHETQELAVHILRGRFAASDLAELFWNASLSDDEIEFFTLFESASV